MSYSLHAWTLEVDLLTPRHNKVAGFATGHKLYEKGPGVDMVRPFPNPADT